MFTQDRFYCSAPVLHWHWDLYQGINTKLFHGVLQFGNIGITGRNNLRMLWVLLFRKVPDYVEAAHNRKFQFDYEQINFGLQEVEVINCFLAFPWRAKRA